MVDTSLVVLGLSNKLVFPFREYLVYPKDSKKYEIDFFGEWSASDDVYLFIFEI